MDDEFAVDADGQLDLFGSSDGPADDRGASPWDAEVPEHFDPPEEQPYPWEDCGDDDEAWLRSLPADIRAEIEARPQVPPSPPGASLWDVADGAAAFTDGGLCDTMPPGSVAWTMLPGSMRRTPVTPSIGDLIRA